MVSNLTTIDTRPLSNRCWEHPVSGLPNFYCICSSMFSCDQGMRGGVFTQHIKTRDVQNSFFFTMRLLSTFWRFPNSLAAETCKLRVYFSAELDSEPGRPCGVNLAPETTTPPPTTPPPGPGPGPHPTGRDPTCITPLTSVSGLF